MDDIITKSKHHEDIPSGWFYLLKQFNQLEKELSKRTAEYQKSEKEIKVTAVLPYYLKGSVSSKAG